MGDSMSAMYDDYDKYKSICKALGIEPKDGCIGGYHTDWVNLKFLGKTELSYEEWERLEKVKLLSKKIDSKNKELRQLMFELSELTKTC